MSRDLVAIDLGSAFAGCARFDGETLLWAETWKIKGKPKDHPGLRWRRLRAFLEALERPTHIAYEKVRMHMSSFVKCPKCGVIKATVGRGRTLRCAKCRSKARRIERMNVDAAHAYGAGEAELMAWCCPFNIVPIEIHTSAVKKAAVGKGSGPGTQKKNILAAARARWPQVEFDTDDASDAAFIGLSAAQGLGWVTTPGTNQQLFEEPP